MKNLSSYNQDLSVPRKKDLDALETKINGKQDAITGGASTITTLNLTANRALISNSSGKVAVSTVTSTELGYLSGVDSNVQRQLDKQYNRTAEKAYYIFTEGTLIDNDIGMNTVAINQLLEILEKWEPYNDNNGYGRSDYMEPVLVCGDVNNVTAYLKIASLDGEVAIFNGIYSNSSTYYQGFVVVSISQSSVVQSGRIEIIQSVNGETGEVVLTPDKIGAVPTTRTINNKPLSSDITLTASDVGAQPKITVNGIVQGDGAGNLSAVKTISADLLDLNPSAVGLGNVDNVKQYSATNPPPYPVTSVNGMTGAVTVPEGGIYQTSYVGTGAYGSANPNTLSFDFVPKLVMITILSGSNAQVPTFFTQGYAWAYFMNVSGTSAGTTVTASAIVVTWSEDGKTLSWYGKGTTATGQLNADGYTYRVMAFQ